MIKNQFEDKKKYTISNIVDDILCLTNQWVFNDSAGCPWYRGQDRDVPPLPFLYREKYEEFFLNTTFRNRASALIQTPETDRIDKWLFLMQHYGVPTRLLDWTEGLLHALFFALDPYSEKCKREKEISNPSIWALHPYELNKLSGYEGFPNTWTQNNVGNDYFRLAFYEKKEWISGIKNLGVMELPIAVHSNYLDSRILSQRSCFTIHGTDESDFVALFEQSYLVKNNYLLKFTIPGEHVDRLLNELNYMGINKSAIFPDIEHLALELKKRFRKK